MSESKGHHRHRIRILLSREINSHMVHNKVEMIWQATIRSINPEYLLCTTPCAKSHGYSGKGDTVTAQMGPQPGGRGRHTVTRPCDKVFNGYACSVMAAQKKDP